MTPANNEEPGRDGTDAPHEDAGGAPGDVPVEKLAAERDDLLARLQRLSADYLNYQKRIQREIDEARDFANAELIRELLAVLDDMERALEAGAANHPADDPLLIGMTLVYRKALDLLQRYGLKQIQAEGRPFDPTRHQAMMQQPSDEHETPTVVKELQRGYELHGRVLRPAGVIVTTPAGEDQECQ